MLHPFSIPARIKYALHYDATDNHSEEKTGKSRSPIAIHRLTRFINRKKTNWHT